MDKLLTKFMDKTYNYIGYDFHYGEVRKWLTKVLSLKNVKDSKELLLLLLSFFC